MVALVLAGARRPPPRSAGRPLLRPALLPAPESPAEVAAPAFATARPRDNRVVGLPLRGGTQIIGGRVKAVRLAAAEGASVFGIMTVLALCALFFWMAASSGSSPLAWCFPAGMAVMGTGLLWGGDAWPIFLTLGVLLIAVGGFVINGYRAGFLPRSTYKTRYKRSRYKLPPL